MPQYLLQQVDLLLSCFSILILCIQVPFMCLSKESEHIHHLFRYIFSPYFMRNMYTTFHFSKTYICRMLIYFLNNIQINSNHSCKTESKTSNGIFFYFYKMYFLLNIRFSESNSDLLNHNYTCACSKLDWT